MKKAVVLLSGGLDSTTALYWAKARGYEPLCLSVLYGQRHAREMKAARLVAERAGAPLRVVHLALPWLEHSSLVNPDLTLPDVPAYLIGHGSIPSTYVPGRNTVFLALALSLADAEEAAAIVLGSNVQDYSGYPDCRPAFTRSFERVAKLGSRRGAEGRPLKVLTPLVKLDKKGIVRLAAKVRAPLELTWSCYLGASHPCGACDSCKLRAKGFAEAGVADPALA